MPFDGVVMEVRPTATTYNSLSLVVRMPDGGVLLPSALVGDRLIDALTRYGISIRTGDAAASVAPCARFKRSWADRLPPPDPDEEMLLSTWGPQEGTNRLLSRIVLTPELDGLELELPWAALVPQTYWVAG